MFRLTDRQVKHRKYIVLLLLATTFIVFSWRFLLRDTINIQSGYLFLNSKNSDADISIVIQGESSIVCVSKVFPDLYSKIFSQVSHVDRIVISHGAMSHKDYLLINKQSPKDLFLFSVLTGYENMEYLEWSMLFNQDESFLEERFNCCTQLTGNASI